METIPSPSGGNTLYEPLHAERKQIRLLTILRGDFGDEVWCTLHIGSLLDACSYETISYAWGDPKHRSSILVNSSSVDVPYSSMAAVRRMRLPDLDRVVWIDSICINQRDNLEKNAQVALMSSIYSNGIHNLVFLGGDQDDIATEVQSVIDSEALQEQWSKCFNESWDSLYHVPMLSGGFILGGFKEMATTIASYRSLLEKTYDLPWFRRLWVLQEVAMARDNTCHWGTAKIKLDQLLIVAKLLQQTSKGSYPHGLATASMMFNERAMGKFQFSHRTFFSVAQAGEDFEATDPRDRVFAHISRFLTPRLDARDSLHARISQFHALYLAPRQVRVMSPLIAPDYSKTTQEVSRDATRHALEGQPSEVSVIWGVTQHISQQDLEDGITTWTFPFGNTSQRYDDRFASKLDHSSFHAGVENKHMKREGQLKMIRYPDVTDPNILTLYVTILDSILETTTVLTLNETKELALESRVVDTVRAMTDLDDEATAFVLTAEGRLNYDFPNSPMPGPDDEDDDFAEILEGYHAFLPMMRNGLQPRPKHREIDTYATRKAFRGAPLSEKFLHVFRSKAKNRRFFKTTTGLVGSGPQLMEAGDLVVIPERAWEPCVLRPVGTQYLFLGGCICLWYDAR
ncbi:unnamed protein product [Cercospora beticola]|nr:unnamed protein product [Cercospora beticola]